MPVQALSGAYYVFIAILFFAYWLTAQSRLSRLTVLLFANYLFCARFGLFYVLLLPACATTDYLIGLGLMRTKRNAARRLLLAVSVAMNSARCSLTPRLNHWNPLSAGPLLLHLSGPHLHHRPLPPRWRRHLQPAGPPRPPSPSSPPCRPARSRASPTWSSRFDHAPILSRDDGGRAFFLIGTRPDEEGAHRRFSGREPGQSRLRYAQPL